MLYLNEKDVNLLGIDWNATISEIEKTVECIAHKDTAQPVKPYLRYKNLKNRIIAMPAYVGGEIDFAGIKWIASFPENINKGMPRAHSIIVLNDADTGSPMAIINTALLSIIRTASVSGLMIKYFTKKRKLEAPNIGIIGWGPIGQYHYKMCKALFKENISNIFLYDKRGIQKETIECDETEKVIISDNWEEVYDKADVFICCTVSDATYIDRDPKAGSLLLNVSLRDFKTNIYETVKDSIIVDDWEEVCREKTDIEMLHLEKGLNKEDTKSIIDVVCNGCMNTYPIDQPVMFNPMGMAVFDIAIAAYYFRNACKSGIGTRLD